MYRCSGPVDAFRIATMATHRCAHVHYRCALVDRLLGDLRQGNAEPFAPCTLISWTIFSVPAHEHMRSETSAANTLESCTRTGGRSAQMCLTCVCAAIGGERLCGRHPQGRPSITDSYDRACAVTDVPSAAATCQRRTSHPSNKISAVGNRRQN